MFKKFSILILLLAISSCSWLYGDKGIVKNRDRDYLHAKTVPPLMIPPGMSSSTFSTHYPISDRSYPGSQYEANLMPPELKV